MSIIYSNIYMYKSDGKESACLFNFFSTFIKPQKGIAMVWIRNVVNASCQDYQKKLFLLLFYFTCSLISVAYVCRRLIDTTNTTGMIVECDWVYSFRQSVCCRVLLFLVTSCVRLLLPSTISLTWDTFPPTQRLLL